jgi:hypothetical protein
LLLCACQSRWGRVLLQLVEQRALRNPLPNERELDISANRSSLRRRGFRPISTANRLRYD